MERASRSSCQQSSVGGEAVKQCCDRRSRSNSGPGGKNLPRQHVHPEAAPSAQTPPVLARKPTALAQETRAPASSAAEAATAGSPRSRPMGKLATQPQTLAKRLRVIGDKRARQTLRSLVVRDSLADYPYVAHYSFADETDASRSRPGVGTDLAKRELSLARDQGFTDLGGAGFAIAGAIIALAYFHELRELVAQATPADPRLGRRPASRRAVSGATPATTCPHRALSFGSQFERPHWGNADLPLADGVPGRRTSPAHRCRPPILGSRGFQLRRRPR